MSQTGSLRVRVFTSRAQFPIVGATVVVSGPVVDGRRQVFAILRTDSSGLTDSVTLDAPDRELSQDSGNVAPFGSYTLVVEHPDYYLAVFDQLQIFSGVMTVQDVMLDPLPQPADPEDDSAPPVVVIPQAL